MDMSPPPTPSRLATPDGGLPCTSAANERNVVIDRPSLEGAYYMYIIMCPSTIIYTWSKTMDYTYSPLFSISSWQTVKLTIYLNSGHDGAHEVGNDEVVPEVDEPGLNLAGGLTERTAHEDARTQVDRVGVELVDEQVEVLQ